MICTLVHREVKLIKLGSIRPTLETEVLQLTCRGICESKIKWKMMVECASNPKIFISAASLCAVCIE